MAKLNKSKKDKEIYWYLNKKGEKLWMYRHKYEDTLGNRREKKKSSFKSEDAALKALLKVKSDLLNGNHKQVEKDRMTVAQWMDIWYETYHVNWKEPTQILHKDIKDRVIKPLLGKCVLPELDKSTYIRLFINKLKKKYASSTVKSYNRIFKLAVNAAVDDEILPRNRFTKISIQDDKLKDNFLTPVELYKLLDIAEKHTNETTYAALLTLAYTGLRKGEAIGLRWCDIDFKQKTITVKRTRDDKGVRSPKTANSYRTIQIDDLVVTHLKKYKTWCKERKFKYGKYLKEDDIVFISYQNGNPITFSTINYGLKRAIEVGNLKSITVHGLRHTHATILMNKGVISKVIAERLGNTPEMIDKVYGHILKETENKAVEVFGESLGAVSGAN
ncbi:tyrosine-type recombinase/integrase [Oceanobacillus oncorhynchi]|uniref:tyrosine-type recombinase/integrase n=1 Tax=Oceanobacillus oncorhynchi TaxID=545501 RepID=UPI0025A36270|nr:site-specific integrase [Oceanobacillus oncorhynchi]MDM8100974.1 site-specific integrase [Oceanobacillus oncorhynchi]